VNLQELCSYTERTVWAGKKDELGLVANARTVVGIVGPNTSVKALGSKHIECVRQELKRQGLSGATINRKLAALGKMAAVGYELGEVAAPLRIRKEREGEPRSRILTQEEQALLFSYLPPDYRNFCTFLVNTGLRVGEALRLGADDIQGDTIRVANTKGGKLRTVPINAEARMAMSQGRSGTIKQATLNYHFNRAKALSGLTDKDLVVHSLRHTFASRLVKAGVNLAVVQKLLGHSSIVVTMRYSHLDMVDLQSAVARI